MHIWIITQYYKPEPGAPSARLSGFAEQWVQQGQKVTVLTAQPNHPDGVLHPDYEGKPANMTEQMDGVTVKRHRLRIAPNRGFKDRVLSHTTFALSLLRNFFKSPDKPSVIIASSPSFFCVFSGWLLAKRFGVPFVFEVRDPWPGIFVELGILKPGLVLSILEKLEMFLYRRADRIVTVTKSLKADMVARGVDEGKIHVITNGLKDGSLAAAEEAKASGAVDRLRSELQLNPLVKVVLYMGTHGISQGLGQVIDTAKSLLARSDILFLFVGDGADKPRLKKIAQGLPNVQFVPNQPREKVWAYYAMANVCLVPLRDIHGFRKLIPSKLFETLGCGRPTIAALAGESAQMLKAESVAMVIPPEDSEKLAYGILKMVDNPEQAEKIGTKAKEWVKANFLHSKLAADYLDILSNTAGKKAKPKPTSETAAKTETVAQGGKS